MEVRSGGGSGCGTIVIILIVIVVVFSLLFADGGESNTTTLEKSDIADLFIISDFQLEYSSDNSEVVQYSFVVKNKSNANYSKNAISFVLYVYDDNNELLSSYTSSNEKNFKSGDKVELTGVVQGISNATWGKITVKTNDHEYTSKQWFLTFSYGVAGF